MKKLRDIIKNKGFKLYWIADQLGLSQYGLQLKLDGKNQFTQNEIKILKEILGLSDKEVVDIFLS